VSDYPVVRTAEGEVATGAEALKELVSGAGLRLARARVDNRPVVRSSVTFAYEDFANPRLIELRDRYRLRRAVAAGRSQLQQMLLLRHWVHQAIPRGMPAHLGELDSLTILDCASRGDTFYCSHYAMVMMQCALALGWQARRLGIDRDHTRNESSTHHGVTEVWSDQLDKWIVVDAMFDVHYEKAGVPLNALELGDEWSRDQGADVEIRRGPRRRRVAASGKRTDGFSEPACYYWSHVYSRNNYFALPPDQGGDRLLLYRDAERRRKTWYQGSAERGTVHRHRGYSGRFLYVDTVEDVYWSVNRTEIRLAPGPRAGTVAVNLDTFTPGIKGLSASVDGKAWRRRGREFLWTLRPGKNSVAVRAENVAGVRGPVSSVELTCRKRR
jgi:hypothetical protein